MIYLIKNEVYKIIKQKKVYIFMGIMILLMIFQYIGYLLVKNMNNASNPFQNLTGQSFPLHMLNGFDMIIVIFITILLADMITDEYKNGTLKLSLLGPITRTKLFVSKVIGLCVGILFLLFFTMITSYIFGAIFFGWGGTWILNGSKLTLAGQLEPYSCSFSALSGIIYTAGSYLLSAIPYLAFGMIVFLISLLFSNMGSTIGTALGIWITFNLLNRFVPQIHQYLITTYFTFYSQFANGIDIKPIIIGLFVILIYGIVFFSTSLLIFKKKDILL